MRYTVTFDIYIDARDDQHAFSKAQMIADNQNLKHANQQWAVTALHQTPFASLMSKEIDIDKLKLEKIVKDEEKDLPF
jgi:hypothetical protein